MTCHCGNCGSSTPVDTPTYICPHCGSSNCTCCQTPEQTLPETHRVQRLIAPSRDTHTNWNDKDPIIKEGVLGYTKDRLFNGSLEYFIGDGVHKYSELTKYAAAEASTSKKANTLVLRNDNGKIDKASLPDDLTDLVTIPDATPTIKGIVKASTTKAADNAVKSDADGGLDGWKDAIIDAIIADDGSGGLSQGADGNLEVDFDAMYMHNRSKFEALLKSLKMQIPLEADTDFYVDTNHANAADAIVDGRGTQNLPFKTIQACVNFVTQNYALGPYKVTIYVAEGTYTENVSLPGYTTTSGYIILRALDYAHPPTVINSSGVSSVFGISGNRWDLKRLIINGRFADNGDGNPHYSSCVSASSSTASINIYGCTISAEYVGETPVATTDIRVLAVDSGAAIGLQALSEYQNSLSCVQRSASHAYFFYGARSSRFISVRSRVENTGVEYSYPCSGTANAFCYLTDGCAFQVGGSGTTPQFSGSITGKAYVISGGSSITLPPGGFPGDVETSTKETDTYCWVR